MFLISGSSNQPLASKLAEQLSIPLADIEISKFPNGEKRIWVKEDLTDKTALILQSFSNPVDEHVIELALIADACRNLNAKQVIAVIPWMGYSPQDKEFRKGEPISIHVIANIIESMGVDHLITIDIHSLESLRFFNIPVTHMSPLSTFVHHLNNQQVDNQVVVAVDKGSVKTAQELANHLDLPLVVFDKHRDRANGKVVLKHISGVVKDRHVLAIDDFVSTGSTRIQASQILKQMGALTYTDCITHALLAGESSQKLQDSLIDHIIITDTYLVPPASRFPKLKIITIAPQLAETIQSVINKD